MVSVLKELAIRARTEQAAPAVSRWRGEQDRSRVQGRMPRHWTTPEPEPECCARRPCPGAPARPKIRCSHMHVQVSMHGGCVLPWYLLRNTSTAAPAGHHWSHLLAVIRSLSQDDVRTAEFPATTDWGSTWTPGSDHCMFNDQDREPWEVAYEPMAKRAGNTIWSTTTTKVRWQRWSQQGSD
jgi:hypothetical protein